MAILKGANMGLAFLLELAMLAALAYWGSQVGSSTLVKVVLAVGAPLVAIVIWAIYNAPLSSRRLAMLPRIILELFMFTLTALALVAAGQPTWALIFMVLVLVNLSLAYIWKQ